MDLLQVIGYALLVITIISSRLLEFEYELQPLKISRRVITSQHVTIETTFENDNV